MILFLHELKQNSKSLIIWTLSIGLICLGCLFMYDGLQSDLQAMSDMYANMGAVSIAMGMDKISIATMDGFYATEIGMMFSLGGALYAGMLGISMLSKEEEGHVAEFLHTFPISRNQIVTSKYIAIVINLLILNVVCPTLCYTAFPILGNDISIKKFMLFHLAQFIMQIELATMTFMISAMSRKKLAGVGLGGVFILYVVDLMCRILPDIKNLKYITPFYYSNGADIFYQGKIDSVPLYVGIVILLISLVMTYVIYGRRNIQ